MPKNVAENLAKLKPEYDRISREHLRGMFENDPQRFKNFSLNSGTLFLDYSKNIVDLQAMDALLNLARDSEVEQLRDKMWAGEHINSTEDRAVMHMALRHQGDDDLHVDGENISQPIREVLAAMRDYAQKLRSGQVTGFTGKKNNRRRQYRHWRL